MMLRIVVASSVVLSSGCLPEVAFDTTTLESSTSSATENDASTASVPACGNGIIEPGEACDDGNRVDDDACQSDCRATRAVCGDGVMDADEACDDGNGVDLDRCDNTCVPSRYVFISSGYGPDINGRLGGVAAADAYCQVRAVAAKLPGTYKAWLTGADAASAPAQRFGSQGFAGWYLVPTEPPKPVARGWADLTSPNVDEKANYLQRAINADENGISIAANAWTNTNTDGTQQTVDKHCLDWNTDNFAVKGGTGRSDVDVLDGRWTTDTSMPCNLGAHLYCFQID